MKKIYIIPSTFVVELTHTHHILIGSDLQKVGSNYEGTLYDTNATGDGLAKGIGDNNIWDDEW